MKIVLFGLLALLPATLAQLTGAVGPTTSTAAKRAIKTCSVLDYGGKADQSTDLGPALTKAWAACVNGGIVTVPAGNYALATWVTLNKGKGVGLQIDGTIYRTGTAGGNMIAIENSSDVEVFSSTGKGAIQGNGYQIHPSLTGARIIRFIKTTHFSLHDLILVDAPAFHVTLDTCTNAEVYNMIVRGANNGGLDGFDIWGTNIHVHDVMVTNKDECVTVKSPASNILIEQIYCNLSGGSAMGSLSTGTAISNVVYRKVYTQGSNQAYMIKSNGGDGYVENLVLDQFINHNNAYTLDIDQAWSSQKTAAGNGVQLSNVSISNWSGDCASGTQRGPMQVKCAAGAPCAGLSISNFNVWTKSGKQVNHVCQNAYGSGGCLKAGSGGTYTTTQSITATPTAYAAPTMPYDLATGFGFTVSIPIPTSWPASFYPNTPPKTALAH